MATEPKPIRSRRKKIEGTETITGIRLTESYCRKCMKMRPVAKFFSACDPDLDTNGLFSVCKDCVNKMYDDNFLIERSMARTILKLCRILNVYYSEQAVNSVVLQVETLRAKGKDSQNIFGLYKGKLTAIARGFEKNEIGLQDLRFVEPDKDVLQRTIENTVEDIEQLKIFWGAGLTDVEYEFLEIELDRYKKTHKSDTASEESLLRQICFAELDIRNGRESGKSTAEAVKRLQDLMKTASVDPAKASIANAGKSQDTFSSFIKTIEENEPAEYYEDKELFKDIDNINWYFKKYLQRPMKNFITGSRDFDVSEEEDDDEDEFGIDVISEEDLF